MTILGLKLEYAHFTLVYMSKILQYLIWIYTVCSGMSIPMLKVNRIGYFVSQYSYENCMSLCKHAYSNILKILPPKNEKFQIKNSDIFHVSAQNIDCGYSLEPPH